MELAHLRKRYEMGELRKAGLASNPIEQFKKWFQEALNCPEIAEPNAMILSSASKSGEVSSRTVLLKGVSATGFRFFTNCESRKGHHMQENPQVALLFFWPPLERQVKISGTAKRLSEAESLEYFHSRPAESQIGAWASPQSQVVPNREFLEARFAELTEKYQGQTIPLPPYWGGYEVAPSEVEFWQGRPGRLHDRLRYRREGNTWLLERLAP